MPATRKIPTPFTLHTGDCLEWLSQLPAQSVDSIVTDPPYGLEIARSKWDKISDVADFSRQWGTAVLRVLKPGGHILAFGGTRTWHHLATGLESAGFEMRDTLMWLYGKGCPKNMTLDKQIDKKLGAVRQVVGVCDPRSKYDGTGMRPGIATTARQSRINGSGPVRVIGRKEVTIPATAAARQWEGWVTNIKPAWEPVLMLRRPCDGSTAENTLKHHVGGLNAPGCAGADGRFPSNVLIDHDVARDLDAGHARQPRSNYFYCAKPTLAERCHGVEGDNDHPTVKPLELMRWLVRLVTPPRGVVLDPFAGSGTTGVACLREGLRFIGIEQSDKYAKIAYQRLKSVRT